MAAWILEHDALSYELMARVFDGRPEGLTRRPGCVLLRGDVKSKAIPGLRYKHLQGCDETGEPLFFES